MKVLISIILNAFALYLIAYFLRENPTMGLDNGVDLNCNGCSLDSLAAIKNYIVGGVLLGVMNVTIRPILKMLSIPFYLLTFGLISLALNGIILSLFTYIMNDILMISGIGYEIQGWVNFIIAVAIFTVLNTLYTLVPFKKY